MKNEVTMQWSMSNRVRLFVRGVTMGLASIYSVVMEQEISEVQAGKLTQAAVALISTVFLVGVSPWVTLFFAGWFFCALRACKRVGLK